MGTLSSLAKVYDLDTLDTRFTSSSTVPYQSVVDARRRHPGNASSDQPAPSAPAAPPPRWQTPEFYFYYLVFGFVVPYMFWIAYDVSRRAFPPSPPLPPFSPL